MKLTAIFLLVTFIPVFSFPPAGEAFGFIQDRDYQVDTDSRETVHVDPSEEEARRITREISVVNAPYQVSPWHELELTERDKKLLTGLSAGVDVALNFPILQKDPRIKAVKVACDLTKIGLESAVESVEYRGKLFEGDLLVISGYADRLKQIHESGRSLRDDPEAKEMISKLEQRMRAPDEPWYEFAGKSIWSTRMVYAFTKRLGFERVFPKMLGKTLSERLGWSKKVKRFTKDRVGWLANRLFGVRWSTMTRVSKHSESFSDAIIKLAIKSIAKELTRAAITEELDKIFEDIMRERTKNQAFPSNAGSVGYDRNFAAHVRLQMVAQPALVLRALEPVVFAPQAVAVRPILQVPARVEVQRDPVVNAAAVQAQVFEANYSHDAGAQETTYRSEPVSGPLRESRVREFDVNRHFRGSWSGASGTSLWSR